jgi:DUF4097 and DUF4098 domain-containing protein YvlB
LLLGCTIHIGSDDCDDGEPRRGEFRAPPETLRCPLAAPGLLDVETRNGAVELRGGDVDEVVVVATVRVRAGSEDEARELAGRVRVQVNETAEGARVALVVPEDFRDEVQASAGLSITAPARARVHVRTSNAAVRTRHLRGPSELRTSNGRVEAHRIRGALNVDTSNGAVELSEVDGPVTVETSNGGVEVRESGFPVKVVTSNGAVTIRGLAGEIDAASSNGAITCVLPERSAFTLKAVTSNARVRCEFGERPDGQRPPAMSVSFRGGGPRVRLSTSNGDINVRKE